MKQIFTVFAFTLKDAIRKKAFIISTAIILVLIIGGSAALAIFMGGSDEPDEGTDATPQKNVCYYLDEHNLIPGAAQALTVLYDVKEIAPEEKEDVIAQIKEDKNISLLEVGVKILSLL